MGYDHYINEKYMIHVGVLGNDGAGWVGGLTKQCKNNKKNFASVRFSIKKS